MDLVTTELLDELIQETGENRISLYMPTHPFGREQQQDPIRLKNLVQQARDTLEKQGLRKPEIDELLQPAEELLDDSTFWQHQSDGLAVFIGPDYFKALRQPMKFKETFIITDRFHIKPLLPSVSQSHYFYILALSKNDIRLLRGAENHVVELALDNTPTSMAQALWDDDPERQLQYHSGTDAPGTRGSRPSIYHGHGVGEDDSKTNLLRYFQKVDRGILELIGDENVPMVLAGVEYLLPIYREASQYPNLVDEVIPGNPDDLRDETLHEKAWNIVEPVFLADRDKALERYRMLSGSDEGLASERLVDIVAAAHAGQVEVLFAARGIQVWGNFDAATNKVEVHPEFEQGDQDLLNLAAVETLSNRGTVYVLEPEEMPGKAQLAAIFRYAYPNQG